MQNIRYLKHVALGGRPIGTVPSSINKCLLTGSYGLRLQLHVEETLKNSFIFIPQWQCKEMHLLKMKEILKKIMRILFF